VQHESEASDAEALEYLHPQTLSCCAAVLPSHREEEEEKKKIPGRSLEE
jgi:hypothetical protein